MGRRGTTTETWPIPGTGGDPNEAHGGGDRFVGDPEGGQPGLWSGGRGTQALAFATSGAEAGHETTGGNGCCLPDKNPLNGGENVKIRDPGVEGVRGKKLKRGQPTTVYPRPKNMALIIKKKKIGVRP